ncbi:MAG: hypothetical protein ACI86H_001821 [bacterium]|jgi:hypothetical protein
MTTFFDALSRGNSSTAEALEIFDNLDPVETNFMLGSWKGSGFPTNHSLDGLLEAYHWRGKYFKSEEEVHPLVFLSRTGRKLSVNPSWVIPFVNLMSSGKVPKSKFLGKLFQVSSPLFATKHGGARLRMTNYRGKESATMIYNNLPINDIFRKVDDNTVLGVMDLKGLKEPFFFVLQHD